MPSPIPARLSPAAAARTVWAIFALGLGIAVLMVIRSQVGGDQLNLLARGWLLAARGQFIPFGNPMSTGGKAPGGIARPRLARVPPGRRAGDRLPDPSLLPAAGGGFRVARAAALLPRALAGRDPRRSRGRALPDPVGDRGDDASHHRDGGQERVSGPR